MPPREADGDPLALGPRKSAPAHSLEGPEGSRAWPACRGPAAHPGAGGDGSWATGVGAGPSWPWWNTSPTGRSAAIWFLSAQPSSAQLQRAPRPATSSALAVREGTRPAGFLSSPVEPQGAARHPPGHQGLHPHVTGHTLRPLHTHGLCLGGPPHCPSAQPAAADLRNTQTSPSWLVVPTSVHLTTGPSHPRDPSARLGAHTCGRQAPAAGASQQDPGDRGAPCVMAPARDTTHLLELLLIRPVPVVRRLQLGGHVGCAPGVGRAGPCSLLATGHAGPTVATTEGLGRWGLAGEQSSMAQASRTGGPEPLFILVVLLVLILVPVLVPIPQVFLQLLLLLLFPFRLPGVAEGRGQQRGASSPPPGKAGSSSSLGIPLSWLPTGPAALSPVNPDDRS